MKRTVPAAVALALAAFMVPFTIYDQQISQALAGRAAWFAYTFEVVGQLPLMIILALAALIIQATLRLRSMAARVAASIPLFALAALGSFFSSMQTVMYLVHEDMDRLAGLMPVSMAGALVVFALLLFFVRRQKAETLERWRYFAFVGLIVAVALGFTVENIKNVFGRTRPREMDAVWSQYGPWYLIHGKTGSKSFPSGHAAYAFSAVFFSLLARPEGPWRKRLFALGLLWGVAVALSRVLIGAHFPTDVTAAGIPVLVYFLLAVTLFREGKVF